MLNKIEVPETFVAHSPQPKGGAIVVVAIAIANGGGNSKISFIESR